METQKNKQIREFNTSGICYPSEHYYVSRTSEINKALFGIEKGRYYTLFSSRQMGKTTFVYELVERLDKDKYCPVMISFEAFSHLTEEEFYCQFYREIRRKIPDIVDSFPEFKKELDLIPFFSYLKQKQPDKGFVLIIDEFDGLIKGYIGDLLHTFRKIYFDRGTLYNLHSLILIGVRNITDVNMDNASPFNTNDEIQLPLFSKEQVFDLMAQYEKETGQLFAEEVKERVYYNTRGQPGLVNALCKMLVEDYNPGEEKEIGIRCFNRMFSYFIHGHISKNVVNIINKAKRYKDEIIEIFDTNKKVEFNVDTEWIGYMYINGAIDREVVEETDGEVREYIRFLNPIYQKKLYNYFKPDTRTESALYISVDESFKQYINPDNSLNILGILKNYQNYVNRRGKKAFSFAKERKDGRRVEAVYHYSLDSYLDSVSQAIGGFSTVEFPTGNGKVDIFFYYQGRKYLIEIKSFANQDQIEKAKEQACGYAKSEGLKEVYLVIFSEVHPRDRLEVSSEEAIGDIVMYSVLINVNFEEG